MKTGETGETEETPIHPPILLRTAVGAVAVEASLIYEPTRLAHGLVL